MAKTMLFDYVGNIHIIVHGKLDAAEDEWEAMMQAFAQRDASNVRTLAFTDGGGPNLKQRRQLSLKIGESQHRVAGLVTSRLARVVAAAVSLSNPNLRIFSPASIHEALDYLAVPSAERARVIARLNSMQAELNIRSALSEATV